MKSSRRVVNVQYLRAVAALMIVYYHLIDQVPNFTPFLSPGSWFEQEHLARGVDVFFVISGFVMVATTQNMSAAQFMWRRIIRIVPLYWLLTLALVAVAVAAPALFRTTHVTAAAIIKSLLFIPYATPDHVGPPFPVMVAGWTLNLEMFFYVLFALTLISPFRRWQVTICGVVLLALTFLPSLGWVHGPVGRFYCDPYVLGFWAGMALARLYSGRPQAIGNVTCVALLLAGCVLLVGSAHGLEAITERSIAAAAIVAAALALERVGIVPRIALFELLGDASYSIYLTHVFTLGAMRALWRHVYWSGASGATAFALVSVVAVCVVAVASYRYLELPMLRMLQRLASARGAAVSLPIAGGEPLLGSKSV